MTSLLVTDVHFTSAHAGDVEGGLLGFLSCVVGSQLKLDGITLRRTRDGRLTLSFPVRHDRDGRQHPLVRPVNDLARRNLEAQVIAALGRELRQRAKDEP